MLDMDKEKTYDQRQGKVLYSITDRNDLGK